MIRLKKICVISLILALFTSLCACSLKEENISSAQRTIFSMDTVMDLTVYGENSESVLDNAENLIYEIEKTFSVTDTESEIAKINAEKNCYATDEVLDLISFAISVSEKTGGALDISMYPLVSAYGFTKSEERVPDSTEIVELLSHTGFEKIELENNHIDIKDLSVDLGSMVKGYTGDRLWVLLRGAGIKSAILNLGGNVQTKGRKPDGSLWKVAIIDPKDTASYIGYVEVEDKAVVTSGAYQRFFEQDGMLYHHIIDPKTGCPAKSGLASVTVISENGTYADALSTALFVMGLEKAEEFYGLYKNFEAVFVDESGKTYATKGLKGVYTSLSGNVSFIGK